LGRFKQFLDRNGYNYSDNVLNAKFLGVPQNRRRYVLLATRVAGSISLPVEDRKSVQTVREAIGDSQTFPPIEAGHKDNSGFLHSTAKLTQINLQRIKKTPTDGGSRKAWADNPELQLKCYENYDGHTDIYGRLYWDRPAPTITTKFPSISNGRYGHPEQNRGLSLREGAILQSFSLTYKFYASSQGKISRLIGNAVPPRMAERIGTTFLEIDRMLKDARKNKPKPKRI
jgi:DNA (cytosine-5)-methyltransferase 1